MRESGPDVGLELLRRLASPQQLTNLQHRLGALPALERLGLLKISLLTLWR